MLKLLSDLKRVVSVSEDLIFLAGRSLQRRALRNGILVALAYGSTLLGVKVSDSQQLTEEQILGLLVAAFASYPAGTLLTRISNFLTRGNLNAAAAGHLHLTSHYKQSRIAEHLGRIWDGVFRYESSISRDIHDIINARAALKITETALHDTLSSLPRSLRDSLHLNSTADEQALCQRVLTGYSHDSGIEATREMFIYTGHYALCTPLPQILQRHQVGFDISALEDWYEKGLFAYEDYPEKSFGRDPLIREIRYLTGNWFFNRMIDLITPEPVSSFWYALTARKCGVLIGKGLREMNDRIPPGYTRDYFNAQHFIWPSPEMDDAVATYFNEDMKFALIELRKNYLRDLFSSNERVARHHVFRLFARDFRKIFKLRLAFDVEYAAGLLQTTPHEDIEKINKHFSAQAYSLETINHAKQHAQHCLQLANKVPELLDNVTLNSGARRAISIAVYCDYRRLKSRLLRAEDSTKHRDKIKQIALDLIDNQSGFSDRLVRLRLFHVLVLIQMDIYWDVVKWHIKPAIPQA